MVAVGARQGHRHLHHAFGYLPDASTIGRHGAVRQARRQEPGRRLRQPWQSPAGRRCGFQPVHPLPQRVAACVRKRQLVRVGSGPTATRHHHHHGTSMRIPSSDLAYDLALSMPHVRRRHSGLHNTRSLLALRRLDAMELNDFLRDVAWRRRRRLRARALLAP